MSSGVALAIIACALGVTFALFAILRMRRTFEEPGSTAQPLGAVRSEIDEGTRPTLVPERPTAPAKPAASKPPAKPKAPRTAYVASQEDEDDVPTTLYRKEDDPDVEALLAEFDTEDAKR